MGAYTLGQGVMTWPSCERVGDRYGLVMLLDENDGDAMHGPKRLVGMRGKLCATVLEVRKSDHIGDLFRGMFPGGATLGETLDLGEGALFYEHSGTKRCVGVEPDDGRDTDWLRPKLLYRAHECVVRLTFTPDVP